MKLIENWKEAYKFLSVIAASVGGVTYTIIQIINEAKGLGIKLPDHVDDWVAYLTLAGVIAGRVIDQKITPTDEDVVLDALKNNEAPISIHQVHAQAGFGIWRVATVLQDLTDRGVIITTPIGDGKFLYKLANQGGSNDQQS